MWPLTIIVTLFSLVSATTTGSSPLPSLSTSASPTPSPHHISIQLFSELEELSRLVDITYCVGTTGISKPFNCASRCSEFVSLELVSTFNTGPLMSDSCGYIALDHRKDSRSRGRILVAFRGTYSITNTIVDLSTVPQEYVPYPDNATRSGEPPEPERRTGRKFLHWISALTSPVEELPLEEHRKCRNCTVHTGFWTSWQNTRPLVLPHLEEIRARYPEYKLHVVGHSLGGAVAALAALELEARGWRPTVTTFGEPRVGNAGLRDWIDLTFGLVDGDGRPHLHEGRYRRVTHVDDPVPLLPLEEWGYQPHAGEVYIAKSSLQPSLSDVLLCLGDDDPNCITDSAESKSWLRAAKLEDLEIDLDYADEELQALRTHWGLPIPARYKIWQLFFAHRDYFWRLGLCVPGGDPYDWGRDRYGPRDGEPLPEKHGAEDVVADQMAAERAEEL
jgi:pimeloyl-ACP methyl ester carboxylesterase